MSRARTLVYGLEGVERWWMVERGADGRWAMGSGGNCGALLEVDVRMVMRFGMVGWGDEGRKWLGCDDGW